MSEYNPLGTSGGSFDDFDAAITDARFFYNEHLTDDNGNFRPCAELTLTPAPDQGIDKPFTRSYTIGNGWEVVDGGARVVRADNPDDDSAQFNGATRYGKVITAVAACGGDAVDEIIKRYDGGKGLRQLDAAFLVDMDFHWEQVKFPTRNPVTGEDKEASELLPASFNGSNAPKGKTAKAPAKKAPAKAKAKAKAKAPAADAAEADSTPAADEHGMTEAMYAQAKAIYDEIGDADEFIARVLEEVDGVDAAIGYVTEVDGGLFDHFG